MRGLLVSLGVAGAALAMASPAAAQYYPHAYGGYGYNGYGYNHFGQVRALQARIDSIEYQIRMLDRRDVIRDNSADRLKDDAERIENRLHRAARYGLNPYEANDIQARIANLEQRVRYASYDRYGRYDRDEYGYGYNGDNGYYGRDRDWDNRDRD
jgi:hypothetical protein